MIFRGIFQFSMGLPVGWFWRARLTFSSFFWRCIGWDRVIRAIISYLLTYPSVIK
ncbi:hypothetical protein BD779DRAFT_1604888 [Infundibulicybe gibba]|nr:hypothetical protein BD779DRAFT_1604888 [Infundibulicybe gibba]